MNKLDYTSFHDKRKDFLDKHKRKDHVVVKGKIPLLISAPHGVNQTRNGKLKFRELGSIATALYLQKATSCHMIAKTKNVGDANYDEICPYRESIEKIVEGEGIKYLIDFHGLASYRECDVNLGVHLGRNVETDPALFEKLKKSLEDGGFVTYIDTPFMASGRTIAGASKNKFPHIWTMQVEINCDITNKRCNFERCKKLLEIFEGWIKELK